MDDGNQEQLLSDLHMQCASMGLPKKLLNLSGHTLYSARNIRK
jgi:hypothetical protein